MKEQQRKGSKGKKSIGSMIAIALIALAAYIFDLDSFFQNEDIQDGHIPVELVKTVDGDTIQINYKGKKERVRYLLIDTPEIDHKNAQNTEACALEATARNEALLKSGQVTIEFENEEARDNYDRLLAYIYVDGKSVQETLLEEGYARVAYVYDKNSKHLDQFSIAEKRAKDAKKGVWAIDGYVTNRGFNTDVLQNAQLPCQ